ncbi:MAG: hypothetical protein HC859_10945 [Bacteroidia bacterium]|nr:hypothetical protein [Bacteroidia bacterium]
MNLDKLSNPVVKAAIDALQRGHKSDWRALFSPNASLLDDGRPRDLMQFTSSAWHERFTSIDRVEHDGCDIYGHFHSDQWGDFETYFKFHIGGDNKISRLEIGQAL